LDRLKLSNSTKKDAVVLVLAVFVLIGLSYQIIMTKSTSQYTQEKMAIKQISKESSMSLSTTVVGTSGNNVITINSAIINDATGTVNQVIKMEDNPALIPIDGSETIVHVNLTSPLLSGKNYTVTLVSPRGSAFVSSAFTVP